MPTAVTVIIPTLNEAAQIGGCVRHLAWAAALDRLLGDPTLAGRLGRAATELVRRDFTLERTAERTEVVYREARARRALLHGEARR